MILRSDITVVCKAMEFGQFPLDKHKCYFILTSCKLSLVYHLLGYLAFFGSDRSPRRGNLVRPCVTFLK